MKTYLVGGAVRDKLLNLPVKEKDWVVVGATVQDMLSAGYRQVGKEFPVFLHPKTNEEYALARLERKVQPGYKGFTFDSSPNVKLEEDLIRRDLTINAMAQDEKGTLIDPYHGKQDIQQKMLRHVSPAFVEDPVRILRVGRFYARFANLGFKVAPETIALMRDMVVAGEVDALVAERVWKELERSLTESMPDKFFYVLAETNALKILFPHLQANGPGIKALQSAASLSEDPVVRFAALLFSQPEDQQSTPKEVIQTLCQRYRVPTAYKELAVLTALHYQQAFNSKKISAEELLQLFNAMDIYRREPRWQQFLLACVAIAKTQQIEFDQTWLAQAAQIVKGIDVQALIKDGFVGNVLAEKLRTIRLEKLTRWLKN